MATKHTQSTTGAHMSVASLLSPPEMIRNDSYHATHGKLTPHASFSSTGAPQYNFDPRTVSRPPLSPPISPNSHALHDDKPKHESVAVVDPPLFPAGDQTGLPATVPLFESRSIDATSIINQHIERSASQFDGITLKRPSEADYQLAVSIVAKTFNENPRAWLKQEREYLSRYGAQAKVAKRPALKKLAPALPSGAPKRKVASTVPKPTRAPRAPKRTPKSNPINSFDDLTTPSPRGSIKIPSTRDDVDFASLPDYAPPSSTLPNNSKCLKTDWKGTGLDLSNDPNRHLLHEAEVHLASTLRLSCAHYLTAKRRIFIARIHCLQRGKEFRKTDAQQACKIDVNKASKLWACYDKVDWLRPSHFQQYL